MGSKRTKEALKVVDTQRTADGTFVPVGVKYVQVKQPYAVIRSMPYVQPNSFTHVVDDICMGVSLATKVIRAIKKLERL